MAPSPRPSSDQVTMREILALISGLTERVEAAAKDAREARDAALGLRERISAENTQEQVSRLWAELKQVENASRVDLVNAMARLGENTGKVEARVAALEAWRNKIDGANGLVGWLAKHAPWLVTAALALAAVVKVGRT